MSNTYTDAELLVLQYYSLVFEPLNSSEFSEMVDHIDFRTFGGLGIQKSKLGAIKKNLIMKGAIIEVASFHNHYLKFNSEKEREILTQQAINQPWLNEALTYIDHKFRNANIYYQFNNWKGKFRDLRDLRINVYLRKTEKVDEIESKLIKNGFTDDLNALYNLIFFNDENIDFLKSFSVRFQKKLLKNIIESNFEKHLPYEEYLKYLIETKSFPEFQANFEGNVNLFQGNFKIAKQKLISANTNEANLSLAVILFLEGDFDQAKILFDQCITQWRKENQKKKGFQDTWQTVIYGLCLLKLNRILYANFADKYEKSVLQKTKRDYPLCAFRAINDFLEDDTDFTHYYDSIETDTFSGKIIKLITTIYIKELNYEASFKDVGTYFIAEKFNWLSFEWANCTVKLNYVDLESKKMAKEILSEYSFQSLARFFPKESDWEKTLNQLNLLIGKNALPTSEKESRIIWQVNFKRKSIQPIEQKKTKTGWTTGRNVALKRLFERKVENMLQKDIDAVNVGLEQYSYGYYGSEGFEFNFEKTIFALVGHPHIYIDDITKFNIELDKIEPNLIIKNVGNNIVVFFDREIKSDELIVEKETAKRYTIFKPNNKQVEIARILKNDKLVIPNEAKDSLLKVIKPLTSDFSVQSDLEEHYEDLPTVEAISTIHGLIIPNNDGFLLELFVKPFEVAPPYLKPGKGQENLIGSIDGIKTRTKRNIEEENFKLAQITESCGKLFKIENANLDWEIEGIEQCLEILEELQTPQKENILVLEWPKGKKLTLLGNIHLQNISMKVSGKGEWFEIKTDVKVNENLVFTFQQLAKLLAQSLGSFIELSEGQYISITDKLRKKIDAINCLMDDKQKIHFLRAEILEDFSREIGDFKSDKTWKEHINRLENARKYQPILPQTFEAELRPYQLEGFNWLASLANWGVGACLADDMGLGKTIQALALLTLRAENGPALVVAPVSVCRNWIKEAARFAPTLKLQLFGEGNREESINALGAFDVMVVSYALLQSEEDLFVKVQFATILLDEAQAIKNKQTKRSKTVMNLKGDFKMVTTGTPIENHLGELWNLFNFLNPSMLGSYDFFQERFAVPIEKFNDVNKRQALQKLIKPFILRRRKNQVLDDLPSKTEIMLTVTMSEQEKAFYEALRRNAIENLEVNDDKDKRFKILAELTRLRLACCHPKLVNADLDISSSKLELFGETIEELIENKHKALVFSQFTKHLHIIEEFLKEKNINYHYLDGSTPSHVRQERIDAFQKGEGDVFLISLKAGGTGLNLTAADYVIHLDPWWNPAVEDQASDRAHRMGQQRPVTVYRLVTENTIEEKILKLHETKRDLADSLLEGTDSSSRLSVDDLLNLIKEV